MAKRDIIIDTIKGLCIILVILGHSTWVPEPINHIIYSFHVPVFFLISGMFAKVYEDADTLLWRKSVIAYVKKCAKLLLIPYGWIVAIELLYTLLQTIHYGDTDILLHFLCSNLWAGDGVISGTYADIDLGPIWFLLALFWAKTIFYVLSVFVRNKVILTLLCASLSFSIVLIHPYFYLPWCIGRGFEALIYVALGWVMRTYPPRPVLCSFAGVTGAMIWMYCIFYGKMNMFAFEYNFWLMDVIGAIGAYFLLHKIFTIIYNLRLCNFNFLLWCGMNSLIVLCMHDLDRHINVLNKILSIGRFDLSDWMLWMVHFVNVLLFSLAWTRIKSLMIKEKNKI